MDEGDHITKYLHGGGGHHVFIRERQSVKVDPQFD